ncbi:MAG: hypothetical protein IKW62_01610 [Clostridia bacterium]|nr:hypothetical protein [Clostridia bacterium]
MFQNSISYGYYFNDYSMGQTPVLSAQQFSIYEKRARTFLKSVCTAEVPEDNLDDVFACVCAVAEELYHYKDSHNVKSENIDGYSVTFSDKKNIKKDLYDIAKLYLGHLGILYAGVE